MTRVRYTSYYGGSAACLHEDTAEIAYLEVARSQS